MEGNGEGSGNGFVTREQLLARGRRTVQTSLGPVLVRSLGYGELASLMGALLDVASLAELGEKAKNRTMLDLAKDPSAMANSGNIEKVLVAGVLEPQLGTDAKSGPTPAYFNFEDQMVLFTAICELSGYSKKDGQQVRP